MTNKKCNDENILDKISIEDDDDVNKNYLRHMYYGTISVCIIYIIISFIILGFGYFTEIGRKLIFGTLLPFMVIYIIGSIIIIVYFAEKIYSYKKPKRLPILYQKNTCPDYWETRFINDLSTEDVVDPNSLHLFKTKCVLPTNIISKKILTDNNINTADNEYPKYKITNTKNNTENDLDTNEKYHIYVDVKNDDIKNSNIYSYFSKKFPKASVDELIQYTNDFITYSMEMNKFKKSSTIANDNNNYYQYELLDKYNTMINNANQKQNIINDPNIPIIIDKTSTDIKGYTYLNNKNNNDRNINDKNINELPIVCDSVYPRYLAQKDNEFVLNNPGTTENNLFRCAYANVCGMTWTDINCDDNINIYKN